MPRHNGPFQAHDCRRAMLSAMVALPVCLAGLNMTWLTMGTMSQLIGDLESRVWMINTSDSTACQPCTARKKGRMKRE